MATQVYEFRWNKYKPWKGRRCVVERRGALNTAKVRFLDDGSWHIVSRNALRKARSATDAAMEGK